MQAARYGKRSHRRDDSRADIGLHEFKQVLDRSPHRKMPLNWATGLGSGKLGAQILLLL
jgi:hypothetical protein